MNYVRLLPYAYGQHINVLKHFVYAEYRCGKQFEVAVRAILQATFPSPKNGLLGYESTQSPIFDLDHGAPIFERGQEKEKG
jgi:hypothetical protein